MNTEKGTRTIFGVHAVSSVLQQQPDQALKLMVKIGTRSARVNDVCKLARKVNCPIEELSQEELDPMASGPHQGVVLKIKAMAELTEKSLDQLMDDLVAKTNHSILLLILEGVTDPRNLGACLRSAAAARADAVIIPKRNSADLSDVAIKAASGGSELVPLFKVTNLGRTIDSLKAKGIWTTGTVPDASLDLSQVDMTGHTALILGSEGKGIKEGTLKRCDYLASIPMPRASFSLNVSVAAGVALYEVIRQRKTHFE